jgi:hypothetical protein
MVAIQEDVFVRRAQSADCPIIQQFVFEMDAFHYSNAKDRIKSPDEARLSPKDFD